MLVPFAVTAVVVAVAVAGGSSGSDGADRVPDAGVPPTAAIPRALPDPSTGLVSVQIPAVAVARIENGRLTAAWTNSGGPPQGDEQQVHVAGEGRSLARPAGDHELAVLVRCAAQTSQPWVPGSWVELGGEACRL